MTPERGSNIPPEMQSKLDILAPKRQIDRVLGMKRDEFKKIYIENKNFTAKYVTARSIILDGRFENPEFLINEFVSRDPGIVNYLPEESKTLMRELNEKLKILGVEKGIIPPSTISKDDSEKVVERRLAERPNLKELIEGGVPLEVMAELIAVDMFSNITDEKKIEEYRSWITRSILRVYLGVLRGKRGDRQLTIPDLISRMPKEIFQDPEGVKSSLVKNYLEREFLKNMTEEGIDEGLAFIDGFIRHTEDENIKEFIQSIHDRVHKIATNPLKGNFRDKISVNGAERDFPSFEQRTFTYDFNHHNTRLIAAETGLGKTGTAFLAMENTDATRVLVFAPSDSTAWRTEEEKLFVRIEDQPNIYFIKASKDLEKAARSDKKYIVISQKLLGRAKTDPALSDKLKRFVQVSQVDGAIIDEIDNLNNPNATSTQTVIQMTRQIRENYSARSGKDKNSAPIIGLTATPIRNKLSNLNVPMGILYPERFAATHDESTDSRKTFSDTCLNRPDLVRKILIGERRMLRWEQAKGVQEFKWDTQIVPVSSFEELLYTFVANETEAMALDKIRLLENVLFNPLLVKAEVLKLAGDKIPKFTDIDDVLNKLALTAREWKRMRGVDSPASPDDYLTVDKLVDLGMEEEVLACFFSEFLREEDGDGIETIVEQLCRDSANPDLREVYKFWQRREVSSKYTHLKELLKDKLAWKTDETGKMSREKVFIVSPAHRQGRTGDVLQNRDDDTGENKYPKSELKRINDMLLVKLVREWTKGSSDVLVLDGNTQEHEKDARIKRWMHDPSAAVLIATLKSTYQSRDYTIKVAADEEGRFITGVEKVFISPPWYYQELKQMAGRSIRQGHIVPVHVSLLESEGLIDHGKYEAVFYSELLSRMAISGIPLTAKEQEFFDSKRVGNRVAFQSPEKRFLGDVLGAIAGRGEDGVSDILSGDSRIRDEITVGQLFAEKYFDEGRDEYRIPGYNAELVAYLTQHFVNQTANILSIGAGTLLLQRKLKRGIDNVDINPHMMRAGWTVAQGFGGRIIEGRASSLSPETFPDSSYDLVDSSFVLNWSKLAPENSRRVESSERVKILTQINRVLKEGGHSILTFPENHLDDERFNTFIEVLEKHFGLKADPVFSGRSYGRSKLGLSKRLGWCITGTKIGEPNLAGLNENDLQFINELSEWVSTVPNDSKKKPPLRGRDTPDPHLKIDFRQYEIVDATGKVNTLTKQDQILPHTDIEKRDDVEAIESTATPLELATEGNELRRFLRGRNEAEYNDYVTALLRPSVQIMNISPQLAHLAEEECFRILTDMVKHGEKFTSRVRLYSEILTRLKQRD